MNETAQGSHPGSGQGASQGTGQQPGATPQVDHWAREALLDLARAGLIEQRRARRWRLFFRLISLGILVWLVVLFSMKIRTAEDGKLGLSQPTAAIIDVSGVIAAGNEASADVLNPILEKAFKSRNIKGIVLRMNSPGGSPVQAGRIYDEITRLRKKYPKKPIYAVTEDICASGCYYIASAVDKIYADKASIVGSIGVRMDGFGFVDTMKKLGVERRLLTAGANKAMFDPFSPENPQQVAYLQDMLDRIHQQFIDAVKQGRGKRLKVTPEIFSGLVYTGDQAVQNGLVDDLGSVRSVIRDQLKIKRQINLTPKRGVLHELIGESASAVAGAVTEAADNLSTKAGVPTLTQ